MKFLLEKVDSKNFNSIIYIFKKELAKTFNLYNDVICDVIRENNYSKEEAEEFFEYIRQSVNDAFISGKDQILDEFNFWE